MSMFLSIVVLLLTSLAAAMDVQVCGSALDDMLGLVCGHRGFNWLKTQDRGEVSKRRVGHSAIVGWTGIVNECCRRPCSFNQLEQYCAEPSYVTKSQPSFPKYVESLNTAENDIRTHDSMSDVNAGPVTSTPHPIGETSDPSAHTQSTEATLSPAQRHFINQAIRMRFFFVRPMGFQPTRAPLVL